MLWMDALELGRRDDGGLPDLAEGNVEREVRKAWTAFSAGRLDVVETGLWGCGAFGGNKQVKFLVQWIAASLAGVDLKFVVVEEKEVGFLQVVERFVREVRRRGWTAECVFRFLRSVKPCDEQAKNIFSAIIALEEIE